MRKRRSIRLIATFLVGIAIALFLPALGLAGSLEPSSSPAPTMRTLDEIYSTNSWSKKLPCNSQTNCPRFEVLADFNNEAVLDKETGLVWEKSLRTYSRDCVTARNLCINSKLGGRMGWRLPTVQELLSLIDPTIGPGLSLPSGHPFVNFQLAYYWTATTTSDTTGVWTAGVWNGGGAGGGEPKTNSNYFICVRSGQGVDAQ
jgi:hypothetical protein